MGGPMNGGSAAGSFRAKVRMYRHGLGDCMLVTLPRRGGGSYFILIDCGVLLGTPDPETLMTEVVTDIRITTGGEVDLLLGTHEHWDHLSGFIQAPEAFGSLNVHQVWLPWTENPSDERAQKLVKQRRTAVNGLRLSAARLYLAGDHESASAIGSLLEFFGAAKGKTTHDALEAVRNCTPTPRYCRPDDPPVDLGDPSVRLYVLGPPLDEKLIKKRLPSKRHPETYELALDVFVNNVAPGLAEDALEPPFSTLYAIHNHVAEDMDFFKKYWAAEGWRRIDTAWLADSTDLALDLDSATNNTSLVLAIELADGDVLLFAADAQVGNWLSWQDLSWTFGGRTVTGPDLLRRTILYKVGHHGSHNATLREQGLEMMEKLQLAMIPVVEEMARKKNWGQMPLPALVEALTEKTNGRVLQSDQAPPAALSERVVATDLYFEVTL